MLSVASTNTCVQFYTKAPIFSVVLTEFTENYYLQHRLFDRSWKPFEHGMYFFTDWKRNASSIQIISQIARFMELTWGPHGSCRPQVGPILAPWILLSGMLIFPRTVTTDNSQLLHEGEMWDIIHECNVWLTHWSRDKWPPFRRRHFQMHFLEWKCLNFD